MKIRIKVKHLVLGGAAVALLATLLATLFVTVVVPELQSGHAEQRYESGEPAGKDGLLRELTEASGPRKWELIEKHVIDTGYTSIVHAFHVIAGPGSTYTHTSAAEGTEEPLTWEERIPFLKAYAEEGPPAVAVAAAAKQLALYYESEHRAGEAASTLRLAADRLLGVSETQRRQLLAEAERLLAAGPDESERTATARVSGVVQRSDGRPMPRVGVFLREEAEVFHSVREGEAYQMLTDKDGRFSFEHVKPGSYQLYLGLRFEQIDGWTYPVDSNEWIDVKAGDEVALPVTLRPLIDIVSPANQEVVTEPTLTFEWEPVEGAAEYRLHGSLHIRNGSFGSILKSGLRDTRVTLPLEELYGHRMGITYLQAEEGRDEMADPVSLLGFSNPETKFSWSVEALDAEGRLLTRSSGYRLDEKTIGPLPFFRLAERELTEADRLLLALRLDEAMEAYKVAAEANPADAHSLRMIVKLYETKALSGEERLTASEPALPYLEALFELRPNDSNAYALFQYYYDREKWTEAEAMYERLRAVGDEEPNDFESALYATTLMRLGKYDEARPLWKPILEADGSHRFVGRYAASELLLADRPFESALAVALAYPEHDLGDKADWASLVRSMAAEAEKDADYVPKMRKALDRYFAGAEDEIAAGGALWSMIEALRKVN
ncbi:carboxypeptidase regulatory-like domain-containing protein [Paenibacillus sp. TRM 82003]|nr:carboxypeptidase regulatory-like domain-containing protein [Paenibacillus sp. TRM 82003]